MKGDLAMIRVNFKNLEPSDLVRTAVSERLEPVVAKFPDLIEKRIDVTVEMHNSRTQAGPDLYAVKLQVREGRYRGILITKEAGNMYAALAELADNLLEQLNRFGDKARVKQRTAARKAART
jgi:ribosomal subunit interface protein